MTDQFDPLDFINLSDIQQRRVYHAERDTFAALEPISFDECQDLIYLILRNHTLQRKLTMAYQPMVKLYSTCADGEFAFAIDNRIHLCEEAQLPWVVTHEMAHLVCDRLHDNVESHGPEFCGIHLIIVRAIFGPEMYDSLQAAYDNLRIQYDWENGKDCDCWACLNRRF